jgi:hypothetical protein
MTPAAKRAPEPGRFSAAKELFFNHDGSRFNMSRNDLEATYAAYNVPEQLERQWLSDLTMHKLQLLQSPGNWWSIHFLLSHRDCGHLSDVLQARPIGVLWQRIAFAEEQLSYVEMCTRHGRDVGDANAGIDRALANARALLRSCRSNRTRGRVNQLVVRAELARSALRPTSGASGP